MMVAGEGVVAGGLATNTIADGKHTPNGASTATSEPSAAMAPPMAQNASTEPPAVSSNTKKVNLLGLQLTASEQSARKALVGASLFLVVFNSFAMPFMLPKLRAFLGAPFVPMKRRYVDVLFDRVLPTWATARGVGHLNGLRLVDFGSGDGRLVRAAAERGMNAVGYELNPYLAFWSRLRLSSRAGAEIRWANAWSADLRTADIVTVYGRPGDGLMARIAAKCESELPRHAVVVSHFFDIPGWERLLVQDVDGLKLYDLSLLSSNSAGGHAGHENVE